LRPFVQRALPRGSSACSSKSLTAATNFACGDHEAMRYGPSRRRAPFSFTIHTPSGDSRSSLPLVGRRTSSRCAGRTPTTFSRPTASRREFTTDRPGGVTAAATTATAAAARRRERA
jgi:hypothetical protein